MAQRPAYVWNGSEWVEIGAPISKPATAYYQSVAPSTPSTGDVWFSSSTNRLFIYTGAAWATPPNAVGGGSDAVFYESGQTVTTDYTISANCNALAAGPITINSGVTVTVPNNATLVVV